MIVKGNGLILNLVLFLNVKENVVLHFTKQLYTLLKAGVPIIASLRALKEQTPMAG